MAQIPQQQQAIIDRFVAACQVDGRVVAALLGGSYARGMADAYSDLDLYVIVDDAAYGAFFAERGAFIRRLGEPLFLEDYPDYWFTTVNLRDHRGTGGPACPPQCACSESCKITVANHYGFDLLLFILADGTEGELGFGRASRFSHVRSRRRHWRPYAPRADRLTLRR